MSSSVTDCRGMRALIPFLSLASLPAAAAASLESLRMPLFAFFAFIALCLLIYATAAAVLHQKLTQLPDPPPPEYAELEQHADKLQQQGLSHEHIREKLIGAGWDAAKVDIVLHEAHRPDGSIEKLMFYVQDQLRRQKPKEEIRQQLLNAHWEEKLVNLVLE